VASRGARYPANAFGEPSEQTIGLLSELHRFADPAEAAATLALRDGRPEAIGFYLDRRRVHVGEPTTTPNAVFNAWYYVVAPAGRQGAEGVVAGCGQNAALGRMGGHDAHEHRTG
jgi:hypothetical protein